MNRRAVLGSLAALGTATVAGCLDAVRPDPTTALQSLSVCNRDRTAGHTFTVRVRRDGETVHESAYDVERASEERPVPTTRVDCTWGAADGRYVVSARVDGGKWYDFELADYIETDPACVDATVNREQAPSSDDPLWVNVRADCEHPPEHDRSCRIDPD